MRGLEASVWNPEHTSDLLTLSARPGEHDRFTGWLVNGFLAWFHRSIGHRLMRNRPADEEAGFREYSNAKLVLFMEILVTSLSTVIPIAATIALYFVRGMTARLALVALFMILFCTSLAIFTNGRRVEIFAATAAYVSPIWMGNFWTHLGSLSHLLDSEEERLTDEIRFASVQVVFVGTTSGLSN